MDVTIRLLGMLAVLLFGTGLRRSGILDRRRTATLNAVTYYVALPALVFTAMYDQNIVAILTPQLFGGVVGVLLLTAGTAYVITTRWNSPDRKSVALVQSYHSNLGYLGLPLVAATFDADVTAIASVILGIGSLVQVPITVTLLTTITGADTRWAARVVELVKNPVLLTLIAGIVVGTAGIEVASPVTAGLDVIAALAFPLALLVVGASLQSSAASIDYRESGTVVALKLAVMPAFAWVVFSMLQVGTPTFTAVVVMLGMPTAVSTYVFSAELGGDRNFASLNVFLTTLVSVATLFVLITLVTA
ncbi:AEC family transporter [Halovenus marina]|uniref:AEC family transporter n=1 Tax=Halovenus marina TaxID=3396621 RepID=UPI003F5440A3